MMMIYTQLARDDNDEGKRAALILFVVEVLSAVYFKMK
jgi:hypothetical protein